MSVSAISQLIAPANTCRIGNALHYMANGNVLNAADAARLFQDHAFNSTISEIVHTHGVVIEKTRAPAIVSTAFPVDRDHYKVIPHPVNLRRCLLALQSMGFKPALLPDSHKGMGAGHGNEIL